MTKAKNKSKGMADKVRGQKREGSQKTNPFEVKFNRQKHHVLGRKIAKYDRGKPGVARSKAMQKRKDTLLQEYKQRGKSNKFVDRRIGEGDTGLSVEEKMLQRFAVEKQKQHEKTSLFSLNEEEEELTHYGQSLSEIERFEDPLHSDSEGEEGAAGGKIGASIVGEEHFGGFLTRKKEDETGAKKSWKERMEEIITKSKKQKFERQNEREKTIEMTEKLDQEWKELRQVMAPTKKPDKDSAPVKKSDDYDVMVRELQFEIKGTPSDRLKTDEELAQEESEKLQKQEADRLRRMRGVTEEDQQRSKHKSPDDLDDDYQVEDVESFQVLYKDGKLITGDADGDEEEDGDADEDEDEEDDDSEAEDSDAEDDDSGDDAMEHLSDLEPEEDEEAGAVADAAADDEAEKKQPKKRVSFNLGFKEPEKPALTGDELKAMLKKKKETMEAARKELPYTFTAPEKYEDLLELFEGHSEGIQMTILERLRKCHHPSLAEGNKDKLETLFTLLVQYFGDLAVQDPPVLSLMDQLTRPLYDLTQMSPVHVGQVIIEVIKEKNSELNQRRPGRGVFPALDVLMYLKLICLLFPTSDLRHPVVTPAMLFMSKIITQCPVKSAQDVTCGLFTCNLFLEYVSFSKRFIPEAINFLCGVLFLAIPKDPKKLEPVIPPFKPVGPNINLLQLHGKPKETKKLGCRPVILSEVFSSAGKQYGQSDAFRVHSIVQCLKLLHKFCVLYEDLPSHREVFRPVQYFTSKLPVDNYPGVVKELVSQISEQMEKKVSEPLRWLTRQKQRPQPLKQLEPKFEEVFDGKKRRTGSKEENEKQKLLHKVKKERKGAVREIKKDMQFLARQKLQDRIEKDADRKRKVNKLYQDLAVQEGEFKAMKRKKDRA